MTKSTSLKLALAFIPLLFSACTNTTEKQQLITQQVTAGKADFEQGKYVRAYQELLPAAEKGNKLAQYAIGYMAYYGKGTAQNIFIAKQWFEKAAQQGDVNAQKALETINTELAKENNIFSPPAKNVSQ